MAIYVISTNNIINHCLHELPPSTTPMPGSDIARPTKAAQTEWPTGAARSQLILISYKLRRTTSNSSACSLEPLETKTRARRMA